MHTATKNSARQFADKSRHTFYFIDTRHTHKLNNLDCKRNNPILTECIDELVLPWVCVIAKCLNDARGGSKRIPQNWMLCCDCNQDN